MPPSLSQRLVASSGVLLNEFRTLDLVVHPVPGPCLSVSAVCSFVVLIPAGMSVSCSDVCHENHPRTSPTAKVPKTLSAEWKADNVAFRKYQGMTESKYN